MPQHALIIGGTGQIGCAVAAELLDQGWRVTLAARGERERPEALLRRGAALVALDREEPGALAQAIGAGANAVIDTVAFTEAHARQLLAVQADVGGFVVISSASVYRDAQGRSFDEAAETGFPQFSGPIPETQPTVEPGPQTYSTRKVAIERALLDQARCPVTILRPGAIHGTPSTHPREFWFVKRMLDGRPLIPLAYAGRSRFHTTATANIAALVGLVLRTPAKRILNIADPTAPTSAEIGALIARHMGYAGRIVPVDTAEDAEAPIGRSPWSIPRPFTLDLRAAAALGYEARQTYEAAVGATCDWLARQDRDDWERSFEVLTQYPWPLFDYAAEDRVLGRLNDEDRETSR